MDFLEVVWLFMAGVLGVALALVPFGIGAIVRRLRHGTSTSSGSVNRI